MSLLTPPTDNLYKFSAVTGLLILAFSVLYPFRKFTEVQVEVIKLHAKADRMKALVEVRSDEIKTLEIELNKVTDEYNRVFKPRIDELIKLIKFNKQSIKKDYKILARINSLDSLFETRVVKLEVRRLKIAADKQKLVELTIEEDEQFALTEHDLNMASFYMNFGLITSLIGAILSVWGFKKWYKLQIVIDNSILNNSNNQPQNPENQ